MTARQRGLRTEIRKSVPCARSDGGCGASTGEPCITHQDTWLGPASGKPVAEIHGARWRAWLRTQPGGKAPDGVPDSLLRRFARQEKPGPRPFPRIVVAGGSGEWDYGPLPSRVSWHGIR